MNRDHLLCKRFIINTIEKKTQKRVKNYLNVQL